MNRSDPTSPSTSSIGALWRRWGGVIIGVVVAAGLIALVWNLLTDMGSTKREVASTPMLMLPPPPPPPPPPEPEKLPDPVPEKPKLNEPEPTPDKPLEKPMDDKAPSPAKDLGDPVTINSDAQAGTDAFGVGAGKGGGSTGGGGGLGSGSYYNYYSNLLQRTLGQDKRTRQLVFTEIRLDVWLDAAGKTTKVQLVKGSGDAKIDEAVLAMVRDLDRNDERPPASARFPLEVSMKGRRPG